MTTGEQLAIALDALNEISNPLKHMVLRLKPDERIDGERANRIAEDPYYLQEIANRARHAIATDDADYWYQQYRKGSSNDS